MWPKFMMHGGDRSSLEHWNVTPNILQTTEAVNKNRKQKTRGHPRLTFHNTTCFPMYCVPESEGALTNVWCCNFMPFDVINSCYYNFEATRVTVSAERLRGLFKEFRCRLKTRLNVQWLNRILKVLFYWWHAAIKHIVLSACLTSKQEDKEFPIFQNQTTHWSEMCKI